jgi:hypothetical protein
MIDDDHPWIATGQIGKDWPGIIRAAVVHEYDLVINTKFGEHLPQAFVHDGYGGPITITGDDGG